jgi:uncharacterized protein with beta-barrel porin domain
MSEPGFTPSSISARTKPHARVSIAWAHNLIDPAVTLKEQFVAAKNASFRIEGEEPPEDFLLLGVGLSFHPNASDEIFVRYNGAWAEDIQADVISGGGKIRW